MKLADIKEFFEGDNNRYLSPEESAAFIAALMLSSHQGEVSANQIRSAIQESRYYNISMNVLYKTLRFFEENHYCQIRFNKKQVGCGKGRPEKIYYLPADRDTLLLIQYLADLRLTLRPQPELKRFRAKDIAPRKLAHFI